jgi:hypothetical protein
MIQHTVSSSSLLALRQTVRQVESKAKSEGTCVKKRFDKQTIVYVTG